MPEGIREPIPKIAQFSEDERDLATMLAAAAWEHLNERPENCPWPGSAKELLDNAERVIKNTDKDRVLSDSSEYEALLVLMKFGYELISLRKDAKDFWREFGSPGEVKSKIDKMAEKILEFQKQLGEQEYFDSKFRTKDN